ncbi:hypothetical protein AGMMS49975_02270 [Clostridia bacterium]|nr:hypothetical protein AGMMS49975_02270 [Clostridia bacterium]
MIVTIECEGNKVEDLEMPDFLRVEQMLELFGNMYKRTFENLQADPKGIILDKTKTLPEQGVEHGAKLIFS